MDRVDEILFLYEDDVVEMEMVVGKEKISRKNDKTLTMMKKVLEKPLLKTKNNPNYKPLFKKEKEIARKQFKDQKLKKRSVEKFPQTEKFNLRE